MNQNMNNSSKSNKPVGSMSQKKDKSKPSSSQSGSSSGKNTYEANLGG